jgi:hypothetical protein
MQTNFSGARRDESEIQPVGMLYFPPFVPFVYRGITHFRGRNSCPTGKSPEESFSVGREEGKASFDFSENWCKGFR